MRIVDTHQHLWDVERFSYSWVESVPALNHTFNLEDYTNAADGTGIEQTVFVEADVDEPFMLAETQYALLLAASNPLIAGIVGSVRPELPGYTAHLETLASDPRVKGVRRILHTQPNELIGDTLFRSNVGLLREYNLTFDLCVLARQLPLAIELVDEHPHVGFVLDHCANPPRGEASFDTWRHNLREMSERHNVSCKISGLGSRVDADSWAPANLAPAVDFAIECFGWERVMFGSDWPLCGLASSLKQWVGVLIDLTRSYGEEKQRKLFFENAHRIYRL